MSLRHRHEFRWCFNVLKKRVELFAYWWVYTIKTYKFIASKSWSTFVGVWVKHIVEKSCVVKKSTFSIMDIFGQTTTEIIHYYIWCFFNMPVQRGCWVFPTFCSWNNVETIAMAMLGAKPQEKIWHSSFFDLRKFLLALILRSVVEINVLFSILINNKPCWTLQSCTFWILWPFHPWIHQIYVFRTLIHSSIAGKVVLLQVLNSLNFLDEVDLILPCYKTASDQPFLRRLWLTVAVLTFLIPDTAVKLAPSSMK